MPPRDGARGFAKLDPFAVGQIAALAAEGHSARAIADSGDVLKPDGLSVSFGTVAAVVRKLRADPSWRGERVEGSGRPRATTPAQDRAFERAMRKARGQERATAQKARRRVPGAGRLSLTTVRRRLREAGLAWRRRRRKTRSPPTATSCLHAHMCQP